MRTEEEIRMRIKNLREWEEDLEKGEKKTICNIEISALRWVLEK